jgi:NAD(P)-dependent dehydrogenase (short-subunit alcohol dehydrogenase family)
MARRRVVAVTGASAGIGRAAAIAFAKRGDRVGLIARSRSGLEGALAEVEAAGGRGLVLPADVSDPAALTAAADRLERELGPIDIWVNDAMVTVFSPADQVTPEEYRRVTEVTYLGAVHGTLEALRRMKPRGSGLIIQVGSALAYRAIPLQAPYCAAKHAIRGFTDALRCELIHDRSPIRITMVHMPAVNTPQFDWARSHIPYQPQPVPPIFQPEIAARAILDAADRPRREMLVGLPTIGAVLGNKVAPGWLDHYLARTTYDGQHTGEPIDTDRPSNLEHPVEGLHATHGRFDARASARSPGLWAVEHQAAIAGLVLTAAAALAGALWLGRPDGRPRRFRA